MRQRLFVVLTLFLFAISAQAAPVPPATNKDGSLVSGVLEAAFSPAESVAPFPSNLLFPTAPPFDLTLNIPTEDPSDSANPAVALNAIDGFSPTEKWTTTFTGSPAGFGNPPPPGQIDPNSVVPGQSVRVFEVTTLSYPFLVVTGIVRELTPQAEFNAVSAEGGVLAIVPTVPLKEYTTYMAVLTNDINDVNGNDATPSQTYHLSKFRTPLIDDNGNSTVPLLLDETAAALEPLRKITMSMELAAASAGVNPDDIVLSWTVHVQSVTKTLKLLRSIAQPSPVQAAPTGITTAAVGGLGLADVVVGVITLPYFLGVPSEENPAALLTDNWQAEPGAYTPPFDQMGLDPTSTNITIANPFPVLTDMQTVPFVLAVPNENSGFTKPEAGWPVIIYAHGITRNRTDVLGIADAAASVGYAIISMDHPLHGVVPEVDPHLAPFYIENTPFAPIANERTFEADFFNNSTGAFEPDGVPDSSGSSYFNLLNLLTARDNLRQSQLDLSTLAVSLQNISVDGDEVPDLNPFNVGYLGHSYGVFIGLPFLAVEPIVSRGYLNTGGLLLLRTGEAGYFGGRIRALLAAEGILPGTPEFEKFMLIGQTVIGASDSASWVAEAGGRVPIIHNQVQGDDVVPNRVEGSPIGGGEGLNRMLGLTAYNRTQANPDGLHGVARFIRGEHSSLIRPTFPEVTVEMQTQMASFFASGGTTVIVRDSSLLAPPLAAPGSAGVNAGTEENRAGTKHKNRISPFKPGTD